MASLWEVKMEIITQEQADEMIKQEKEKIHQIIEQGGKVRKI